MEDDITPVALYILNEKGEVSAWNTTLITLILKVKTPNTMKEFQPINLFNVLYKIVSKSIENIFRLVLDEVIGDPQSAFVLGRLITYNVLLGFDMMH